MSEFWIAGMLSQAERYHTNADCPQLQQGDNPRQVRPAAVEWHELDECRSCQRNLTPAVEMRLPSGGITDGAERVTVRLGESQRELLAVAQAVGDYDNRCDAIRGAIGLLAEEIDQQAVDEATANGPELIADGGQTVATPREPILDCLADYGRAGLGEIVLAAEVDRSYRATVAALGTLEAGGLVEQVGDGVPQWRLTERGEAHV